MPANVGVVAPSGCLRVTESDVAGPAADVVTEGTADEGVDAVEFVAIAKAVGHHASVVSTNRNACGAVVKAHAETSVAAAHNRVLTVACKRPFPRKKHY